MAHGNVTDEELAELVRRTAEAASALVRGDIRRYLTFIRHADDYTLMAPSGGEPRRGFDASDQALAAGASSCRPARSRHQSGSDGGDRPGRRRRRRRRRILTTCPRMRP